MGKKGFAAITPAEGEHHDIRARLVANFLQLDGGDTYEMGAKTPYNFSSF